MRRLVALTLFSLSPLLVAACSENGVVGLDETARPAASADRSGSNRGWERVKVMTRNIYLGADVGPILEATTPAAIPFLVAQAFQTLLQTNFPERAIALAEEIHDTRPDLVGLQEVSLIRTQSPGDAIVGGTTPATDVLFDYLEILLEALDERGLDYRAVAQVQNADVELPCFGCLGPTFTDVRLTDFDVILAEEDVETSNVAAQNYAARLEVPVGPLVITVPRGFVAVDATVDYRTFRFVNTHLEPAPGDAPPLILIQRAQAAELILTLQGETLPIIAVGDFNTVAPTGLTYGDLTGAGYIDVWTQRRGKPDPGFTCCHASDLSNQVSTLNRRIDLIFVRPDGGSLLERVRAEVVGDDPERDRTPSGLWPSDHGGVAARLRLPSLVAMK